MASRPLLISLILSFLSLLCLSAALPSHTAAILSDSGFNVSMSLTLELVDGSLDPASPWITVDFARPESEYRRLGQPTSLSLLPNHFAPLDTYILRSLPLGTKIPTSLLAGQSLVVTAPPSDGDISLNVDVKIATASSIYDDGFLIILTVERFFDPNFLVPAPDRVPFPNLVCGSSDSASAVGFPGASWLKDPAADLKSHVYGGFKNQSGLTVFAPLDQAIGIPPLQDTSVLLRHVVPCCLDWSDLVNFNQGAVLIQTFMKGFNITIGVIFVFDRAPPYHVNVHYGDSLVGNCLMEAIAMPAAAATEAQEKATSLELWHLAFVLACSFLATISGKSEGPGVFTAARTRPPSVSSLIRRPNRDAENYLGDWGQDDQGAGNQNGEEAAAGEGDDDDDDDDDDDEEEEEEDEDGDEEEEDEDEEEEDEGYDNDIEVWEITADDVRTFICRLNDNDFNNGPHYLHTAVRDTWLAVQNVNSALYRIVYYGLRADDSFRELTCPFLTVLWDAFCGKISGVDIRALTWDDHHHYTLEADDEQRVIPIERVNFFEEQDARLPRCFGSLIPRAFDSFQDFSQELRRLATHCWIDFAVANNQVPLMQDFDIRYLTTLTDGRLRIIDAPQEDELWNSMTPFRRLLTRVRVFNPGCEGQEMTALLPEETGLLKYRDS